MTFPETKREEISEEIFGKKVDDPYRWLEDFNNQEVQNWLIKQHDYYEKTLQKIPNYQKSLKQIEGLLSLGTLTAPRIKGDFLFFQKSTLENQPILYIKNGPTNEQKELINPNELSIERPVALDWYHISPSGNLIAYGLSKDGDEWSVLNIKNVITNELFPEKIPRTRFCSLTWENDEKGFYYTRYPLPGTIPLGQENYNKHVYYHKIGTNWEEDPKIFGEGLPPTNQYAVELSDDNTYLLITVIKYTKDDLYFIDLKDGNKIIEIITGEEYLFDAILEKEYLWILTNKNHPHWVLYKSNLSTPTYENWVQVIPEGNDIISQVLLLKDFIAVKIMRNASDYIKIYSKEGEFLKELDLPDYCTIEEMGSDMKINKSSKNEFYFKLRSFLLPTTIYRYQAEKEELSLFDEIKPPVNPQDYLVKQVWYPSKDGTKISMFIAYHKKVKLTGNTPTLLNGYGGFNIPVKPPYLKNSRFFWLEKGGILAIANLRGGSEYGEEWHKAGMLDKKQNVFDDFIYAAKWLIDNNYTSPKTLCINGRSNGGLLIGAAITQRPDLFSAAYIGVPLLDMIRYHLFSIARYWIPEYGSAENSEQFEFLLKYSPYHNVKKDHPYPPTMLVTAASDSRVDQSHAMKMAAALQFATTSHEPILLQVENQAGHGVGKPLDKLAVTETCMYTFLGWKTGLKM